MVRRYLVVFDGCTSEEDFVVAIKQDTESSNNQSDYDLIQQHIRDEYGFHKYKVIGLDNLDGFGIAEL